MGEKKIVRKKFQKFSIRLLYDLSQDNFFLLKIAKLQNLQISVARALQGTPILAYPSPKDKNNQKFSSEKFSAENFEEFVGLSHVAQQARRVVGDWGSTGMAWRS